MDTDHSTRLPCGHSLHTQCLRELANVDMRSFVQCPVCRCDVDNAGLLFKESKPCGMCRGKRTHDQDGESLMFVMDCGHRVHTRCAARLKRDFVCRAETASGPCGHVTPISTIKDSIGNIAPEEDNTFSVFIGSDGEITVAAQSHAWPPLALVAHVLMSILNDSR